MKLASHTLLLVAIGICTFAPSPNAPAAQDQLADYGGTWFLVQETVTVSNVMVVGRVRSTTRATVLFDLSHAADRLFGRGEVCSLEIDSGSRFVDTEISDGFLDAIPTPLLDAVLSVEGGVVTMEQSRLYSVIGADLEDARSSALPSSESDASVVDADEDGNPGVTIHVSGMVTGDVFVAQRGWTELEGIERSPFDFRGDVRFDQEQVILGATRNRLLNAPEPRPDLESSWFRLFRVPEGTDCSSAASLYVETAPE